MPLDLLCVYSWRTIDVPLHDRQAKFCGWLSNQHLVGGEMVGSKRCGPCPRLCGAPRPKFCPARVGAESAEGEPSRAPPPLAPPPRELEMGGG